MRILIAEDEKMVFDMYKKVFEAEDVEVVHVINGENIVETLQANAIDVVLLDIMMPGVDGLEALKSIKNDPSTKAIPVVAITNLANDFIRAEALNLGAAGFFTKADLKTEELVAYAKNLGSHK